MYMTLQRQTIFWCLAALALLGAFWLLWDVMVPFIAALVIAYLLDPLARRLQQWGMSRLSATLLIMLVFAMVMAFLLLLGIPALAHQIAALVARLPNDVMRLQEFVNGYLPPLMQRFGGADLMPQVQKYMTTLAGQAASWLATFLPSLVSGGQALVSFFSLFVVTPVVVFYLLLDWRKLVFAVNNYLPLNCRPTVWALSKEISIAIDGFLRGQLLVCVCLGLMYAFGLWLIGLNSGITIGMIAGLISFIPYVGSLTGLVLALGMAIAQFWPDWTMLTATLVVFFIGQFIEGNILSPKLVGNAIGLHPVWLMFSLFAFGSLFGFGGLLIAAPAAAVIGVLVRFGMGKYRESEFYRGSSPPEVTVEVQENENNA